LVIAVEIAVERKPEVSLLLVDVKMTIRPSTSRLAAEEIALGR
jgi:hypothetical protein